eukprot:PhM_4_TR12462/c0_g1_i1/m.79233
MYSRSRQRVLLLHHFPTIIFVIVITFTSSDVITAATDDNQKYIKTISLPMQKLGFDAFPLFPSFEVKSDVTATRTDKNFDGLTVSCETSCVDGDELYTTKARSSDWDAVVASNKRSISVSLFGGVTSTYNALQSALPYIGLKSARTDEFKAREVSFTFHLVMGSAAKYASTPIGNHFFVVDFQVVTASAADAIAHCRSTNLAGRVGYAGVVETQDELVAIRDKVLPLSDKSQDNWFWSSMKRNTAMTQVLAEDGPSSGSEVTYRNVLGSDGTVYRGIDCVTVDCGDCIRIYISSTNVEQYGFVTTPCTISSVSLVFCEHEDEPTWQGGDPKPVSGVVTIKPITPTISLSSSVTPSAATDTRTPTTTLSHPTPTESYPTHTTSVTDVQTRTASLSPSETVDTLTLPVTSTHAVTVTDSKTTTVSGATLSATASCSAPWLNVTVGSLQARVASSTQGKPVHLRADDLSSDDGVGVDVRKRSITLSIECDEWVDEYTIALAFRDRTKCTSDVKHCSLNRYAEQLISKDTADYSVVGELRTTLVVVLRGASGFDLDARNGDAADVGVGNSESWIIGLAGLTKGSGEWGTHRTARVNVVGPYNTLAAAAQATAQASSGITSVVSLVSSPSQGASQQAMNLISQVSCLRPSQKGNAKAIGKAMSPIAPLLSSLGISNASLQDWIANIILLLGIFFIVLGFKFLGEKIEIVGKVVRYPFVWWNILFQFQLSTLLYSFRLIFGDPDQAVSNEPSEFVTIALRALGVCSVLVLGIVLPLINYMWHRTCSDMHFREYSWAYNPAAPAARWIMLHYGAWGPGVRYLRFGVFLQDLRDRNHARWMLAYPAINFLIVFSSSLNAKTRILCFAQHLSIAALLFVFGVLHLVYFPRRSRFMNLSTAFGLMLLAMHSSFPAFSADGSPAWSTLVLSIYNSVVAVLVAVCDLLDSLYYRNRAWPEDVAHEQELERQAKEKQKRKEDLRRSWIVELTEVSKEPLPRKEDDDNNHDVKEELSNFSLGERLLVDVPSNVNGSDNTSEGCSLGPVSAGRLTARPRWQPFDVAVKNGSVSDVHLAA